MKIAFSGHRNVKDMTTLIKTLQDLNLESSDEYYVGGATGFDFLVLKELVRRGFKNINLCVPFKGFEKYIEKDSQKLKEMTELHYKSGFKIYEFNEGSSFSDKTKRRNQFMVDQAELLICYWDGSFKSGTAQTVRMAQKKNIEVKNVMEQK